MPKKTIEDLEKRVQKRKSDLAGLGEDASAVTKRAAGKALRRAQRGLRKARAQAKTGGEGAA